MKKSLYAAFAFAPALLVVVTFLVVGSTYGAEGASSGGGTSSLTQTFLAAVVSGLVGGGAMLIGFMAVHKRFLRTEYPRLVHVVEKIDEKLGRLEVSMAGLTKDVSHLGSTVRNHDRRIEKIEDDRRGGGPS